MKAGIYLGKEQIELRELPIPEVGDEDVLVENIYSSICGTDVSVYFHGPGTGHKVTVGGEFGHETVSRIVKVGKNVTDFTVGERVYPSPQVIRNGQARLVVFRNIFLSLMQKEIIRFTVWMNASQIVWQV